jgi:hypothetical protein
MPNWWLLVVVVISTIAVIGFSVRLIAESFSGLVNDAEEHSLDYGFSGDGGTK